MANEPANQLLLEGSREALRSYNLTLPMGSLSIGVDNIHHDVFLSPKFVQVARDYLFDLIRQNTSGTYLSGIEFRNAKAVDSTSFRKLLTELLQSSLGKAKQQKNIEIDLLFRLALLKFLARELVHPFGNVILDVKEYIRKRGEYFERSQQAHVIKARLPDMQSARRDVLRIIGQLVAQIFTDIEENVIVKARRALFGEEMPYYEMLKNRLVFLDGGKDDFYFLEHYVLLGNYSRDPDRVEAMDALFQDFLREAGIRVAPDSERPVRARLLAQLVNRLEHHEVMPHILASYEIRPIAGDYCPPVHLQQLRKALVSKEEAKRVEEILKQVPAKRLTMKPLEELTKRIRRYSREETQAAVLRFAIDFLRLRRDLRDAEHLAACMERINLVTAEKIRELSRINNRLYECLLKEEVDSEHDQVVSHVIIKADVRGSTKMTQDLLARGLSPASHFSLNLHEPVKRLLDRYSAKKVFIEGDAIILAIFETEATQGDARPVAKACALAKQILSVCNSYNDGTATTHLPPLELGIGIAFQGSAPTYWIDGDARIMISKALNLSDRLSGCAKLAKRMLAVPKTHVSR